MIQTSKKVGLLHHVGGGDHGEEASFQAVVQNVRKRWPEAEIFGFSMNPDDTRAKHGIPTYPIRQWTWSFGQPAQPPAMGGAAQPSLKEKVKAAIRKSRFLVSILKAIKTVGIRAPRFVVKEIIFLIKSLRIVRTLDVLVISGGAQLADSGGPWDIPYAVFKWTMLARLARVKCIVLNVGAGPVNSPISKYFVRKTRFSAEYVSFRDEESRAIAQQIGFSGKAEVFPDNAYSLDIPAAKVSPIRRGSESTVGIAPTVYNPALTDSVLQTLGQFGKWLIKNHYCVALFCSHISVDPPAVEKLESLLMAQSGIASTNPGDPLCRVHQWSAEETLTNMSPMDYVVTCRFHGVILAHMLNIPVMAISDCKRMTMLMGDLGLAEYCVEIGASSEDKLREAFVSMVSNREELKNRMAEKLAWYRGQLATQFDELFPYAARSAVGSIGASAELLSAGPRIAG
jgi:polysaccharide pyruvyl transferase WcaK-like protein